MPGNGKFPIEKLHEKELGLIETRPEAEAPAPAAARRDVATPRDGEESGKKKGGHIAETQLDETQEHEPERPTPTSPAPTIPGTPVVPPSPALSVPSTTKPSRSSAKYDKYKDGSYWKILVHIYYHIYIYIYIHMICKVCCDQLNSS